MNRNALIGAGVASGVIGIALVVVASMRGKGDEAKAPSPALSAAPSAPSASSGPTIDQAPDVVAVLQRDYELVVECSSEDLGWGVCHGEEKGGFLQVRACAEQAAKTCAAVADVLAERPPSATTPCGKTVESAMRAYVKGRVEFTKARLEWLDKKKGTFIPALINKTMADACTGELCADKPLEVNFKNADIVAVNSLECVKPLFNCDPPLGNVCWLAKVASRLGLGPEPTPGPLKSAATGADLSKAN
ncbi:MAG: hypothetical protein IPG04_08800 [Polyangiaceae bacterium]|nr:hypothetical protein [Polyangiaceae bacterium]